MVLQRARASQPAPDSASVALLALAGVSAAGLAVAGRRMSMPRVRAARPVASRAGCVQMYWHIYPRDFGDSNFHDKDRRRPTRHGTPGSRLNKEHNVEPGRTEALG